MTTARQIEERTARARSLMARSRAEGFAVGAFNVDNLETLLAIARAAQAMSAPAFIEASASEAAVLGLANLRAIVDNLNDELGVELYLNLDHAPTPDAAIAAIDAGFELVHIDVSQADNHASDDAIVAATRRVVAHARTTGALVEGELRYLPGSSTVHQLPPDAEAVAASLSSPDSARAFVQATGIDTFAVGIGNLHGLYTRPKALDLDLLARIRAAVDACLSLHGGSGIADDTYAAAARAGISKINVNSELRCTYRTALEREFASHPHEFATVKLVGPVIDALQAVVEAKITAFGSAGHSRHDALAALAAHHEGPSTRRTTTCRSRRWCR
jgi:fructose-bisphosphate aldolase class II